MYASTAIGRYNKDLNGYAESYSSTADAFVIGNGSSDSKGNAFRVTFDGKTYGLSSYNSYGADYAEYFEWVDGNPDNEDRVGYFVTVDGDKIRKATSEDDYIVGVVSVNPSVIGDSYNDDWHGKYLTDIWGRILYEEVVVPAQYKIIHRDEEHDEEIFIPEHTEIRLMINPDWNPDEEYIPREKRQEWATVGLMGKLIVRDDGTCVVNGYCKPNDDGIATRSDTGYRVIARLDENVIKILIK